MRQFMWYILLGINLLRYVHSQHEELVDYYEKLIEKGENAAHHSDLPTSAEEFRPNTSRIRDFGQIFDFIVIGAGNTGSVIASRLSEINSWNVLLLEAGGDEDDFTDIPGMNAYLLGLKYNWNFNTTRQSGACLGMIDHRCAVPRGKVMGGSSTINSLVYSRASKYDFDNWQRSGNRGWAYKDVLPYFIKSENCEVAADPGYHGKGGYWNVEYHRPNSPQLDALMKAHRTLYGNSSSSSDYNGREQMGMFYSQINNKRGKRDSLAKAFLKPAENRSNFKILKHSYVTKILIAKQTKKAYGVQFSKDGVLYQVIASKEVILSAGGIISPQILMLSGVGPRRQLDEYRIPLIQDLPVGKQLRDSVIFFGLFLNTSLVEPAHSLREYVEQYLRAYGPLTIAQNDQGLGFYQSSYAKQKGLPDIELQIVPSNSTSAYMKQTLKLNDQTFDAMWPHIDPQTTMNIYLIILKTLSVGNIRLESNDPYRYPLIDFRSLTDYANRDIDTMYEALNIVRKLIDTEPMKKINASIICFDYPQCSAFKKDSKAYWYCAFRLLTSQSHHATTACMMGTNPRQGAVVDSSLRVHGIQGLRVADASIIPSPISGHTSAVCTMIGEKISDVIKQTYRKPIEPITNVIW